jgi:hypothetical protein
MTAQSNAGLNIRNDQRHCSRSPAHPPISVFLERVSPRVCPWRLLGSPRPFIPYEVDRAMSNDDKVFNDLWVNHALATKREMAMARELLCPHDGAELMDRSTVEIGGGYCSVCECVFVWRQSAKA